MGNPYLNLGEGTGLSGGATTTATPPPPPPVDLADPSLALEVVKMPNEPTEEPLNWRRRLPLLRIPESVSISFLLGHGLKRKKNKLQVKVFEVDLGLLKF